MGDPRTDKVSRALCDRLNQSKPVWVRVVTMGKNPRSIHSLFPGNPLIELRAEKRTIRSTDPLVIAEAISDTIDVPPGSKKLEHVVGIWDAGFVWHFDHVEVAIAHARDAPAA